MFCTFSFYHYVTTRSFQFKRLFSCFIYESDMSVIFLKVFCSGSVRCFFSTHITEKIDITYSEFKELARLLNYARRFYILH